MQQNISRRKFVGRLAALSAATMAAGRATAHGLLPFFKSRGLNIGLQIYTLGDAAAKDPDAAFALVAQIGYREIELPNLLGRKAGELKAAADRAGLAISSLHVPLTRTSSGTMLSLASKPAMIADTLGALGAKWAVTPLLLLPEGFHPLPGETFPLAISRSVKAAGADIWKSTASLLNEYAAALNPLDIHVAYHNHNLEFAPIGATTGWEILQRETDPSLVKFEVDIGWVVAAGLDPIRFLTGISGRASHFHVKDIGAGNVVNYEIAMPPTEVGSGTLAWSKILPEAYHAGVRHFFVEQEPPFAISREEAARRSFEFLSHVQADSR